MTMRYVPPGRTSISQTGTVKVCGPHHSDICFGSVHALNTSVRGALMMRVKTISFFARSTCILVVAVIWFVLSLRCLGASGGTGGIQNPALLRVLSGLLPR